MINYNASITGQAFTFEQSKHVTDINPYNENLPLILSVDFNINPMCWGLAQEVKGFSSYFKEYTVEHTITEHVIAQVVEDMKNHKKKEIYIYGDATGRAGNTKSLETDYDYIFQALETAGWDVFDYVRRSNPSHKDRISVSNKRFQDWENDNEVHFEVYAECVEIIDSLEQTQRKGHGILKNNMEHHSDHVTYYLYEKFRPDESTLTWS